MELISWVTSPEAWIALLTLTVLEIVLGIDNVIFISILASKLPPEQQARARQTGLALALITRLLLLASISWIASLTTPWFTIPVFGGGEFGISGRDIILIAGGLFLIWKATHEIHNRLEGEEGHGDARVVPSFTGVIIQIILLDIVFSLDSVITAVGMVDELGVMVTAVIIAVGIMLVAAGPLSDFVNRHPTVKMLALAFLLLITSMLQWAFRFWLSSSICELPARKASNPSNCMSLTPPLRLLPR
jgi:predicted tellurium resistance membrane protein TerC